MKFRTALGFLRVNVGGNKGTFWMVFPAFVILLHLIYFHESVTDGPDINIKDIVFFPMI